MISGNGSILLKGWKVLRFREFFSGLQKFIPAKSWVTGNFKFLKSQAYHKFLIGNLKNAPYGSIAERKTNPLRNQVKK